MGTVSIEVHFEVHHEVLVENGDALTGNGVKTSAYFQTLPGPEVQTRSV